jgi:hypothetical protein
MPASMAKAVSVANLSLFTVSGRTAPALSYTTAFKYYTFSSKLTQVIAHVSPA